MREADKSVLVDRLVTAVERINRRMRTQNLDEWLGMRMTVPQTKTLIMLDEIGPSRMGAIAASLSTSLSATTSVVDRLVERGLVERAADPGDRRVVICRLTPEGRGVIGAFWSIGRDRLAEAARSLDSGQLAAAVGGLEALAAGGPDTGAGSGDGSGD